MSIDPQRFVTVIDSDGKSVFTDDTTVPSSVPLGMSIHNVWGTADGTATVGAGLDPQSVPFPFFPGPGGHRVVVVEYPAAGGGHGPVDPEAAAQAAADAERDQPGLLSVFDPDDPGFHITDSVDYGICLEGEVWLVLDDGQERRISPGTVVVQRGTRHAWQNRSDSPCTMIYVIIGANRA